MSRIITTNYFKKLNEITNEFEIPPNLYCIIDFFLEEIQNDKNRTGNRNQKLFDSKDFEKICNIKNNSEIKKIFAYINIIIKGFVGRNLHIHVNTDLANQSSEYLTTLIAWKALVESAYDKDYLDNEINLLKVKTRSDLIIPDNINRHTSNQIFRKRFGLKHKLKLFQKIKSLTESNLNKGLLLNLNPSADVCVNLSEHSVFPDSINTYVNFGKSLQFIYDSNNSILQNISTIINVFPTERGANVWYQDFIRERIDAWNQFPEFNFSKVITITSGEKSHEALLEMHKLKKFQAEEIYILFPFEF